MALQPVFERDKLGQNDLWTDIRSKVRNLCDQRATKLSSIDLVRLRIGIGSQSSNPRVVRRCSDTPRTLIRSGM